jgi:hypothetical protein
LRSKPAAPQNVNKPSREYDYLDYEENEKKLHELKTKDLDRFKLLLSDNTIAQFGGA